MFGVFSSVLSADSKMFQNARWSALLLLPLKYWNFKGHVFCRLGQQRSKIRSLLVMFCFYCSALFHCLKILFGATLFSLSMSAAQMSQIPRLLLYVVFWSIARPKRQKPQSHAQQLLLCSALSNLSKYLPRPAIFCLFASAAHISQTRRHQTHVGFSGAS